MKTTQCQDILDYLKTGGTISRLDSIHRFGVINLPGRIYDLKAMGHDIKTTMIKVTCMNGRQAKVAAYTLGDEK